MNFLKLPGFILMLLLSVNSFVFAVDIDLVKVIRELNGAGIEVEVHGIDTEQDRYVVTYRMNDFFTFKHFALTSEDASVMTQIRNLKRHDRIRVQGDVPALNRPMLHIEARSLELIYSYPNSPGEHRHEVQLPQDLKDKTEFVGKVHIGDPEGRMLVLDYKQSVLPVLVPKAQWSKVKDLARGDLIRIQFELSLDPDSPVHLRMKNVESPFEILESMFAQHGKMVEYIGDLVMFPKSPQVQFNVFAIQRDVGFGIRREYTLINFENPELFKQMRNHLQMVWDSSSVVAVNDRNKWVKRGLKVRVKGPFNFVDAGQANPQVVIQSLDSIEILP